MQGANTDEVEMLEKQNEKLRERERKLLQQLQSAQFELEAARAMLTGDGKVLTRVQEQVCWGGGVKGGCRGRGESSSQYLSATQNSELTHNTCLTTSLSSHLPMGPVCFR